MPEAGKSLDWTIRNVAFTAVEQLSVTYNGRIPWQAINQGFEHGGENVKFANRVTGIFKPRQMSSALSIKTTVPREGRQSWYRDQEAWIDLDTGLVSYDLVRNRRHSTNDALRQAYEQNAPLIYFHGLEPSCYEAIWPVWVEHFSLDEGRVLLAAADMNLTDQSSAQVKSDEISSREKAYSLRTTKYRNHQAWFSSRTRSAYGYRCAFSGLALGKLLVAAHIKADEAEGPASVDNGICMSTLHHTAFDRYLIGVDPELRIHVSNTVMDVNDGPLLAMIKRLNGQTLRAPVNPLAAPNPEYLSWRFEHFRAEQT